MFTPAERGATRAHAQPVGGLFLLIPRATPVGSRLPLRPAGRGLGEVTEHCSAGAGGSRPHRNLPVASAPGRRVPPSPVILDRTGLPLAAQRDRGHARPPAPDDARTRPLGGQGVRRGCCLWRECGHHQRVV